MSKKEVTQENAQKKQGSTLRDLLGRAHDPLRLMAVEEPILVARAVLRCVCVLLLLLVVWSVFGKLDIIASATGKLVPQTLLKIVQPAEQGIVHSLLVGEGDVVEKGQVLVKLDTTLASAETQSIGSELVRQRMQERRILAELSGKPLSTEPGDDLLLLSQVQSHYKARRNAYEDDLEREKSLLSRAENEHRSAQQIMDKMRQTLPLYRDSAKAYAELQSQGFFSPLANAEKQKEMIEREKDFEAQKLTVASLRDTIAAQKRKIRQISSYYTSELEKELAQVRGGIARLEPSLDKSLYREGLMELRAPQSGVIKNITTTTVGAVVQPGSVLMTLVPQNEPLYADVSVKNEDVGFVQVGQKVQIKLSAYPFQKYGMIIGEVMRISADSEDGSTVKSGNGLGGDDASLLPYRARIKLNEQFLTDPSGEVLHLAAGMQVVAEINQGQRTVLEYLLSPVRKVVQEAARER